MEVLENTATSYMKGNLTFSISECFPLNFGRGKGLNKQLLGDNILSPRVAGDGRARGMPSHLASSI